MVGEDHVGAALYPMRLRLENKGRSPRRLAIGERLGIDPQELVHSENRQISNPLRYRGTCHVRGMDRRSNP